MTPITEDQVLSLMKGLEVREKRAVERLSHAVSEAKSARESDSGQTTARILSFKAASEVRSVQPRLAAEIIPMAKKRPVSAERASVRGRFLSLVPGPTN